MKKQNKYISLLLVMMLVITYILPIGTSTALGAENQYPNTDLIINNISQTTSTLTPDQTFGLKVTMNLNNLSAEDAEKYGSEEDINKQHLYVTGVSVTGDVDASKINFSVDDSGAMIAGSKRTITVGGLTYNGGSKDIEVVVELGTYSGDTPRTVFYSSAKKHTLSAYTLDDLEDTLVAEKQENLLVKMGQTQNVEVKITNKGSMTINQADVKLVLDETVKDVEIKKNTATIKSIASKEVKKASFSIKVGEDAKAGVYKAHIEVLGSSYPVNLQVDTSVVPSALEISTSGDKVFTPGVAGNFTFSINNIGDRDAKNIRVEVVNTENVSIIEGSNVKHISSITSKNAEKITMKLKIASNVKATSVSVPIKLTYLSSTGEEKEDTQYVYLSTSASSASSEVVISNVISPTTTYGVDQNFTIKFNLSSKQGAEKVKISVTGDEGIVPKSQNLFFIDKLEAGKQKEYSVTFAATRVAESSSHPIEISVEYGEGETPTIIKQYGSVNINNPKKDEDEDETTKKGTPKVIIGQYNIEPVVVKAGEEFELTIGFLNTHKNESVHNLKASLKIVEQGENNTGSVFAPVGGSNTFYISDLAPGEVNTKTIRMYTIPSASPKTYEVSLEMEYENEEGEEVKATESLGIPVEQTTKIEIGELSSIYGEVGMETYFSVTLYNTGKTDVSNMKVHIEGEGFTVQDNMVFIGAFEKQNQETYEPVIIPNQAGMLTGKLIVEYEDSTGEEKQIEQEFTIEAEEMMAIDEGADMYPDESITEPETTNSMKWPLIIGIGVGVVIVIIIIRLVLKKRKSNKEKMMLDED